MESNNIRVPSLDEFYISRDGLWCAMYQEGHSVEKLSKLFGFSKSTISKAIFNAKVSEDGLYTQTLSDGSTRSAYILNVNMNDIFTSPVYFYTENGRYWKEFVSNSKEKPSYSILLEKSKDYLGYEGNLPVYCYAMDYCFNRDDLLARYYGLCMMFMFRLAGQYLIYFYEKWSLEDSEFQKYLHDNRFELAGTANKVIRYLNFKNRGREDIKIAEEKIEQICKVDLKKIYKNYINERNMVFTKNGNQTFVLYPSKFYSKEFRESIKNI